MMRAVWITGLVFLSAVGLAGLGLRADDAERQASSKAASQPASNFDLWMQEGDAEATPAAKSNAEKPAGKKENDVRKDRLSAWRRNPLRRGGGEFVRDDALPGVVEVSDGRLLVGGIYTTRGKPWVVWVEDRKRWVRIPPAAVLSITARVVDERMELQWRWKAMGEPEKVFTGKKYPFRRFLWEFHLADGTRLTGAIKGQPLWIEQGEDTTGPLLLQERSKGKIGESLDDLVYVRRVILSRRLYDALVPGGPAESPEAPPKRPGKSTSGKKSVSH